MGKIVEKKKKKKGRPSLLDLQKRTLKEQQQQQQQNQSQNRNISKPNNSTLNSSHNYKSATQSSSLRRSTRRNSTTPSSEEEEEEEEENDAVVESLNNGKKRREKKLKLVLKLPSSSTTSQKSEADSDTNASDEDTKTTSFNRKRKITAIGDGSVSEKGDNKTVSGANPTSNIQDSGPSTPLPDKKLLLFILERLQKKDTYGVFSEPVDPEELPDYHEVIEHPMDFATVREKLTSGAYVNLEQFEKDVFLICSNAMQYNAPDTIYFRQARSIQELAKKDFENLRQDSDDNEPEPTVVRRGRPPSKNLKKPLGRPSLDRSASEYSLGATLATGGDSTIWSNNDLRKGPLVSDKPAFADSSGRSHGCHSDANLLSDNKFERNDEATGSMLKGNSVKYGKRQYALDENRRNTYKQLSAGGQEPSVLATFDSERKQLMAVGLLSEHGYARSLARFAANVGTVAWKIASKRIERCLPPGIKFGPGWVVENDIPPQRALVLSSPPPGLQLPSRPLSLPVNADATSSTVESKESLLCKPENNFTENNMPPNHSASASSSTSPVAASKSEPCTERAEAVERLNSHGGSSSMIRPRPPIQIHPMHPGMNGLNGTYGFNLPMTQMGRLAGTSSRPAGLNFQSSQMIDRIVKPNTNFVHPATANNLTSESPKLSEPSSTKNPGNEELEVPRSGLERRPSWQGSTHQPKSDSGLSPQQKSDSVPPDLNVRFQSPGSPSSTRVDLTQPDLALQL